MTHGSWRPSSEGARVYVVSTGRCGTTMLAERIGEAFPAPGLTHQVRGSRRANILGNLMLAELISFDRAWALASRSVEGGMLQSTADPLRSVLLTRRMMESGTPPAVAIHLVRDPRDFATSFMNWRNDRFRRRVLHGMPFWQPNPLFSPEVGLGAALRMDRFDRFCWVWSMKNSFFQSLDGTMPYVLVRLEELVSGLEQRTRSRLEELGLQGLFEHADAGRPVNRSRSRGFPEWPHWSSARARAVERLCGPLMRSYGYGREAAWESKLAQGDTRPSRGGR